MRALSGRGKATIVTAGAVTAVGTAVTLAAVFGTGASGPSAGARAGLDASTSTPSGHGPSARVVGRYTMPSGGEEPANLQGLAAAHGTAWVTGTEGPLGKAGSPTGIVLRYQGGRLTRLNAPLAQGHSEGGDVAATGGRAWVLASERDSATLLSTDGQAWRRDARPSHGGVDTYGIAAVGDRDMWIVGTKPGARGAKDVPVLLHYDGSAWRRTDKGVGGDGGLDLFGITARASNDVWVAGERSLNGKNETATPFFAHWDGHAWHRQGAPARLGYVRSVAPLTSANAWAVGGSGCACSSAAGPLVLHYDGRSWRRAAATGLQHSLDSVVQDGHGGLWATEDGGRLVHFDGHRWTPAALPDQAAATAVARDAQTGKTYAIAAEPEQNAKVTALLLELN
ncbi:hypothetical protein AB0L06_24755 [Spirillospora sp. NPDC052269]